MESLHRGTEISAGKAFLIVFRILLVSLSSYFFIDVFVKRWGGYSYYMSFMDFLPSLSLAYILWTVIVIVFSIIIWFMTYCVVKLLSFFFQEIRYEHIFGVYAGLLIVVLLRMAIKFFFKGFFWGDLTGLSPLMLLTIKVILVICISFIIIKKIDKLLYKLDNGISLLVWFFSLLVIAAVPLFFFNKTDYDSESFPLDCAKKTNYAHELVDKSASYPNIILVTMDSLASTDMQSYGYDRPTTPFISKWSKDAIVFKEFYSSSDWSPPATMSIMTGQRVWTHGVWHRTAIFHVKPFKHNFPKLLKDNGYDVFGFVQTEYLHPVSLGIGESFSVKVRPESMWIPKTWWFDKLSLLFIERPIAREMVFETNAIARFVNSFRPDISVIETPSEAVYNGFLDCISQYKPQNRHNPFFAWLHLLPPHEPYLPPEPYIGFFGDDDKTISKNKKYSKEMELSILRNRYDELILYSDKQFELFVSRLSEHIDMSNTILILSADHGEIFANGLIGHVSAHLYEGLVRIPFIVKLPGEVKGREINVPVESIDVAPTILKLAGIPVPEWIEGRALLPLSDGEQPEVRPIYMMQFDKNLSLGKPLTKGTVAVREKNCKLMYYMESGKKMLFDLAKDPDEAKDISGDEPMITEHLMKLITDNLSKANSKIKETSLSR